MLGTQNCEIVPNKMQPSLHFIGHPFALYPRELGLLERNPWSGGGPL
jgi:hypothetical protein